MNSTHRATLIALTLSLGACVAPTAPLPAQAPLSLTAMATIPVGTAPHGVAFSQGYVYVGNTGSGSISVIDTRTNAKVTDLSVGGKPNYTTTSPDGKVVVNVDSTGKIRLIDPANGKHTVLQTLDVGQGPDKVSFSPDSTTMAVTLTGESVLPLYTFAQGLAQAPTVARFTVGTVAGTGNKHRGMSYKHGYILAPNTGENNLSLINTATGDLRNLTAGNSPAVVALAGAASRLSAVIGNGASNTITVQHLYDSDSKTFAAGTTPTDAAVTADGTYAFVTNAGSNDVSVVDVAGMKELTRIPVGKRPVHVYIPAVPLSTQHGTGKGEQVWVLNDDGDSVSVIDAVEHRVLATVAVGKGHHKAAFSPTKAYITNITSGDVSVIDRAAIH